MVTARYWHTLPDDRIACDLCPTACTLDPGQLGSCGTRANEAGVMVARQYGRLVSAAVDPIEKKPLYHFFPGAPILSIAAAGCNLHCRFCQNWNISQRTDTPAREATPEAVVDMAAAEQSVGIAYTYSEPLVWFEFVLDTARQARRRGLKNVIVSNGHLNAEPARELLPLIDAANIDLKSMDETFYRKICRGRLQPVLDNIVLCHELGVHVEVTNLVIPGHNDTDDHFARLADFIAGVDRAVPLHLSAYRPCYEFDAPATPAQTLVRAAEICAERLDYVYVGNTTLTDWNDTVCPGCGEQVVRRQGFQVRSRLVDGACPGCGRRLPVVGE